MKYLNIIALLTLSLTSPARAEEVILTGPPIWDSAALIALDRDQPLAEQGITFTFRPWNSPEEMRKIITSDTPAVAMAPVLMPPLMQTRGMEVDLLAAGVTGGSLWLIGRGDAVTNLQGAGGHSISVPFQGNLPDLMLQRIMADTAWQPLYTGSYPAAMQMLLAGKTELALLAEPMASAALNVDAGLGRKADLCLLWQAATALPDCPPGGALIAGPDLAHRGEILQAFEASFTRLADDPGLAHDLLVSQFPDLAAGPGASAYHRIRAELLILPRDEAQLEGFYREIFAIAPDALGGALPEPGFYRGGAAP